eukprot:1190263-Pleurochrysis_carterae.AAC.1
MSSPIVDVRTTVFSSNLVTREQQVMMAMKAQVHAKKQQANTYLTDDELDEHCLIVVVLARLEIKVVDVGCQAVVGDVRRCRATFLKLLSRWLLAPTPSRCR